jgi:hypothetical protein
MKILEGVANDHWKDPSATFMLFLEGSFPPWMYLVLGGTLLVIWYIFLSYKVLHTLSVYTQGSIQGEGGCSTPN